MRTIQTSAIVTPEHTLIVTLPDDVPPGRCQVVVTWSPVPTPESLPLGPFPPLPVLDCGPWPEGFTVSREQIYGDDGR